MSYYNPTPPPHTTSPSNHTGLRLPTALAAHEQLTHALTEQGTWENRAKQARELLNEMLKSRKETAELAKRYDIRPVVHSPV